MPFSTDVRLPRRVDVSFPDLCCGCLRERPGDRYAVKARRFSWWELVFAWLWLTRRPVHCEVPMCTDCLSRASRLRWLRRFVLLLCLAAGVALLIWVVPSRGTARGTRRLIGLGMAALCVLPWGIWHMVRPPLFDVTVGKDHVDYEFANARYADAFRRANERPAGLP